MRDHDGSPAARTAWDPAVDDARHGFVARGGAALRDLLAPAPGERMLDLGRGTGQLTRQIAARGAAVVGMDLSPDMGACARAQHPILAIRPGDATALAFDAEFGGVFSNAVVHRVRAEQQPAAAGGITRALRPGGRLVADLGGRGNVRQIVAALAADALRREAEKTRVGVEAIRA